MGIAIVVLDHAGEVDSRRLLRKNQNCYLTFVSLATCDGSNSIKKCHGRKYLRIGQSLLVNSCPADRKQLVHELFLRQRVTRFLQRPEQPHTFREICLRHRGGQNDVDTIGERPKLLGNGSPRLAGFAKKCFQISPTPTDT